MFTPFSPGLGVNLNTLGLPRVSGVEGGLVARLERLSRLDCGDPPRVSGVAGLLGRLIGGWRVWESVAVEGGFRVSQGSRGLCWALRFLGARMAPVSEGAPERVEVPLDALGVYDRIRDPPLGLVYESPWELARAPTPLVRLGTLWGVTVWAKLEFYHPFTLSVKDRTVRALIEAGGAGRGDVVADASSGNTAVAMAAMARLRGCTARVYLPRGLSGWSLEALKVYGAEVARVDAPNAPAAARVAAEEASSHGWVYLNQFRSDWNFVAHLSTTAVELDFQLRAAGVKPSAVVVATGTCGHGCAVAFFMRHRRPQVLRVAAQPAPGSGIPGIRRRETGMEWIDLAGFDETVDVTLEEALDAAVEAARSTGILASPSGGAVLAAVRKLASRGALSGEVAVVIPDTGYKYLDLYSSHLEARGELEG